MTLNEKFKKEGFSHFDYLAKVADEHAIKFANYYEEVLASGDYNLIDKDKKELLEIFKKKYYESKRHNVRMD